MGGVFFVFLNDVFFCLMFVFVKMWFGSRLVKFCQLRYCGVCVECFCFLRVFSEISFVFFFFSEQLVGLVGVLHWYLGAGGGYQRAKNIKTRMFIPKASYFCTRCWMDFR